jgi:stage II sporulation protein M
MLYASVGILLALWIFRSEASMIMVLLTVIACIPLMYRTLRREEKKDTLITEEKTLLKEHGKALKFLMYLFFGFIVAYALWFIFLPQDTSNLLFKVQISTINQINSKITGNVVNNNILFQIFFNNLKVLFFAILFAFFYGAGAIFILTWNASVIGAAIGDFAKEKIAVLSSYFFAVPIAIGRYMTHGIFEILAYFIGGLAGGIISTAIINHDINTDKFKTIMKDSLDLILLSIVMLILAALVEVFITPLIFS